MAFNYAIDLLGLAIIMVLMVSEWRNKLTGHSDQGLFHWLLIVIAAVFVCDIPAWMLNGAVFRGARVISYILNTGYYVAQISYCLLWLVFSDCWNTRPSDGWRRRIKWYVLPALLELLMIAVNPLTGWVFTLSAQNVYARGTLYAINLIPYAMYILGAIVLTFVAYRRNRDPVSRRQNLLFLICMTLPLLGTVLQMANYGVSLLWPFTVISLIMIYLNVQQQMMMQNRLETVQMERELTEAKVAMMMSQIQPHFLFNALCVIQNLCHDKAPEAEEATAQFSCFLRGNLDSLSTQTPIPFEQELIHTQNYLALEQKRFHGALHIEYDILAKDFSVPALSLQPIAENAVRYGVRGREGGGTVCIATNRTEAGYQITVEDTGVGFDPEQKKQDGRTHIGITNVRDRVERMCGGSLTIHSVPGKGTTVTIFIPNSFKKD